MKKTTLLKKIVKVTAFLTAFSLTNGILPIKANKNLNYSVLIDNPTNLENIVRTDPLLKMQKKIDSFERENFKEEPYKRVDTRDLLQKIIKYKLNTGKFSPEQTIGLLKKGITESQGLPGYMDEGYIYCLINQESYWNPKAESEAGARGLGQIMRNTWKDYCPIESYNKAYDPESNIKTSVKVIKGNEKYFKRFHPNWEEVSREEKLKLHVAAYNWGPSNVKKIDWNLNKTKEIPRETRDHVKKILNDYNNLSN